MKALSEKNDLNLGFYIMFFGTVLILLWEGLLKFAAFEAKGIEPLVANHMFTSWMYNFLSVQGASNVIGTVELSIVVLLFWGLKDIRIAKIAAIGLLLTFGMTVSFLFTTPDAFHFVDGSPLMDKVLVTNFFMVKDIMYFGFGITLLQYANKK